MTAHEPHVSIGILAHNEQSRIGKTLRTLFAQDIFQKLSTEVVVVANGCSDETAAIAKKQLLENQAVWSARGSARVEELVVASKVNAWNQFVHELSSPQASVLMLMDADIELLNSNTMSSMVTTLESSPEAIVCTDRPIKDIETRTDLTFFQRLLRAVTPEIGPGRVPLCGQLYCAFSTDLRQIRLPIEITCEDGFLRALLLTEGFTKPENPRGIVLAPNAAHSFASVATLRQLIKHETWIVTGSIVNMLLFERFSQESSPNRSAMAMMQEWQEQNPEWLRKYIQRQAQEKGWNLLPRSWWLRRWLRVRKLPFGQKLQRLPLTIIAAAIDMLIFIAAINNVRHDRAYRYWGRQ